MDIAASVLGAIVVLIVGTIWRRRKLQSQTQEAHVASAYDFRLRATNCHPDNWPPRPSITFAIPSDGKTRSRRSD